MPSPLDEPESSTPSDTPLPDSTSEPAASGSHLAKPRPLAIEGGASTSEKVGNEEELEEDVQVLDLGEGNVIKLDKLGPMIINSDGTLSRIQNWQDLHPIEQERTVRLLVKKRNLVRLRKLDTENKAEGEQEGEEKLTALQEAGES